MNYKKEAKEIIKIALNQESDKAILNVLKSLLEESDCAATSLSDIRQFMSDLIEAIEYPATEIVEPDDPILEVYSRGIFDS